MMTLDNEEYINLAISDENLLKRARYYKGVQYLEIDSAIEKVGKLSEW